MKVSTSCRLRFWWLKIKLVGERTIWRKIKLETKLQGAKFRVKPFCWHGAGEKWPPMGSGAA